MMIDDDGGDDGDETDRIGRQEMRSVTDDCECSCGTQQ